jgi:hypothetical protein
MNHNIIKRSLEKLIFDMYPLRPITRRLVRHYNLFSYEFRLNKNLVERPNYGYCVYQGALLAKRLGYKRISVIELGVAGGRGLLNLEFHAEQISKLFGMEIEVYGFDAGEGLPSPEDYRDLPFVWKKGFYQMDYTELQKRLHFAKLIIGDVRETSERFFNDYNPAPIAAVLWDLDYYSSTTAALHLFDTDEKYLLPRIFNYFDDIIGSNIELHGDFTGERLAINEFNTLHEQRKFCPVYYLLCNKPKMERWYHQIFVLHLFGHKRYNDFVGRENQQLPLHI